MIFYEAPHKLSATLKDMNKVFGNREIAIVRELTKIHEQVIRTTLDEAVRLYSDGGLKGEMVLIYAGEEYVLHEGDFIHFDCTQPHTYLNRGDVMTEFTNIVYYIG